MPATFPLPNDYAIYKSGSNYKCMKNDYTNEDIVSVSVNTDFKTVWDAFKTDAGNTAKSIQVYNGVYDIEGSSCRLDQSPAVGAYSIFGSSKHGTVFRPTGDFPAFVIRNRSRINMCNFKVLVERGSTFANLGAIRFETETASWGNWNFQDIMVEHTTSSGSTVQQHGDGLQFAMVGAGAAQSLCYYHNIDVKGFRNALHVDSLAGTNRSWFNEHAFQRVNSDQSFTYFKSDMKSGDDQFAIYFNQCYFQTTFIDGTTGHMFDIDDSARHYRLRISECEMWDAANSTHKFLKANNDCRVTIVASEPAYNDYMGGAGWDSTNKKWNSGAKVVRISDTNVRSGRYETSTDGKTTSFTIVPDRQIQNTNDCQIRVWPASGDAIGEFTIPRETVTTSQFVVRYKRPPRAANPTGTVNLRLDWMVSEY